MQHDFIAEAFSRTLPIIQAAGGAARIPFDPGADPTPPAREPFDLLLMDVDESSLVQGAAEVRSVHER